MTRTALYRHSDSSGRLLYIGISTEPLRRMDQHCLSTEWGEQVATTLIEWHPDRPAALAAEAVAIFSERPLHNIKHNPVGDMQRFVAAIGQNDLATRLNIGKTAISNAFAAGHFPCKWASVIAAFCVERGLFYPANGFPWAGEAPPDGICISALFKDAGS